MNATVYITVAVDVEKNQGSVTPKDVDNIVGQVRHSLKTAEKWGNLSPDEFNGGCELRYVRLRSFRVEEHDAKLASSHKTSSAT